MNAFFASVPSIVWAILVVALIIFLGQALHLFTIHFAFSIP